MGSRRPAGFGGTKDDYAAWLADELRRIEGPIDLVGHDWGALLTPRLATTAAVELNSWAVDVASAYDPGYGWHARAQGTAELTLLSRR